MTIHFLLSFILLTIIILIYFRIADHYNIIDKPNHRSSHTKITIRGGGIIFPVAALLWFISFGFSSPLAIVGLIIIATISFIDDIKTLSSRIRIFVHLTAVSLLFWQLQLFGLPWYIILIAYIFTVGWLNAFNFMDGINGITSSYAIGALFTFWWLNRSLSFVSNELIILLVISLIIFSFFNFRKKAKTFAGDIGSLSIAYLLAWLMISLMLKTGKIEYILFFSVYGIDSVITIIYRLVRRENIFEAHRSHLYQYLSNELGKSHLLVSGIYAIVQIMINILTIGLISKGLMNTTIFIGLFVTLIFLYLGIRFMTISYSKQISDNN